MDYLSDYLSLAMRILLLLLQTVILGLKSLLFCHFNDLVFDFVESTPRKNEKMASL